MCSIAGGSGVEEMLRVMRHRGPDDEGVIEDMGMGRLSIIDLNSEGLCPYEEEGYILSFNGEIYNYLTLKEELEGLGHSFHTNSDTEVLLKAYKQWGKGCLDRFNGMFAFAIKDKKRGEIFLARDIAGEKPLYWAKEPFKFASEAKALNWKCREFPPAHYGIYSYKTDTFTIKPWWVFKKREIDLDNAEKELETLLEDSVRLRTQSDVPYGIFYSGGVDSSLIRSFWDFEHEFTYTDGDYQEEFKEVFPKIVHHLDYPVRSFSPFGLWKLAEEAHNKGIKVILSGEGADELFGGYVRYVPQSLMREAKEHYPSYRQYFKYEKNVNQMGWEEFNGNMRELLRMGDRMTSAWGIENRCPFLDRRIIEFAFSLPPEMKIRGFDTKVMLRNILKKRDPLYTVQEKHGLYCSVNKWLNVKNKFAKDEYVNHQVRLWKTLSSQSSLQPIIKTT
jgi:asparagine synthase (glutamine-hydrolysing)